jgi:hypothetical protein
MNQHRIHLHELARQSHQALIAGLASHGLYADAALDVRPGSGLLCHYSLDEALIYLSIPDPATARGKFELLLLRALLRFERDDEVLRLIELLIPWLVAHETGHYLRPRWPL